MARHLTTQRHRAVDIVFEADQKGILVPGLLRELLAERREISTAQVPIQDAGADLVNHVADHLYEIDGMIDELSTWGLRRISSVDRALLRVGIGELRFAGTDLPVVVSEYTALARGFEGDKTINFLTALFNKAANWSETEVQSSEEDVAPETGDESETVADQGLTDLESEPESIDEELDHDVNEHHEQAFDSDNEITE